MIPPDFDYREMRLLFNPFSSSIDNSPLCFGYSYVYAILIITFFITDNILIAQCNVRDTVNFTCLKLKCRVTIITLNHGITRLSYRILLSDAVAVAK